MAFPPPLTNYITDYQQSSRCRHTPPQISQMAAKAIRRRCRLLNNPTPIDNSSWCDGKHMIDTPSGAHGLQHRGPMLGGGGGVMLPSWLCFAYLSLSGPKGVWRLGILVWLLPQPCMYFLP